jgi:serine/threonine protein kinase
MDDLVRRVARVDSPPMLVPGQVLGETYELIDRLGGGGMGVVFRARDRRLGRDVAVKVLRPGADDGAHVRRLFEREARATAQLLHPNIVTLHHVGEHAGHPYLVLELLAGETLAARLARRKRLPAAESLAIVDAVLGALAFAHERGVLHRDLKPNNVFLTVDDRVKVLDFGVALTLDADPGPVTRSAGTPGYMAPEQRDGGAQDARTDVWAAALVLVECLLGRRSDEQTATSALAELDLAPQLRGVLERALAADPADRPRSADELRGALAQASRPAAPVPMSQRRRRRRELAAAAGVLVLGAAAGSAITYLRAPSSSEASDEVARRTLTPPPAPAMAEVAGTYDVNFGVLLFTVDADGRAYGVYQHDDGILVGHYDDGLFMGVWCELPTRRAPDHAGKIEIGFAHTANHVQVEGRWTYGHEPAARWLPDWWGKSTATIPPPGLVERMRQRAQCP